MKTIENGIHYYPRESDAKEGFLARPPAGDIKGQWLIIHGVGERGAADLEALKNVALGWDYDGTGPMGRQYGLLTPELIAQADKHGTLLVIVNYPTNFDPNDIDFVMNTIEADPAFKVDKTRWGIIGFSWGGREVMRCLTSTAQRAARFAVAVVCAPVNPGGNLQYIVDAKLQLIGTTFKIDPRVSATNVQAIITGINKLNPLIKPVYIEWPGDAHGTFNEMLNGTDKLIPQSMHDYLDNVSTLDRKQYPTDNIGTPSIPIPPTVPGKAAADFNLVDGQMITTNTFELDASLSTGATSYYWDVTPITGSWAVKTVGGAGGGPKKTLINLGNGTYNITLTVNGSVKSTTRKMVVAIGSTVPPVKKPMSFDSVTDLIMYSDGSTDKGTAVFSDGQWTVKNAAGQVIQL